MDHTKIVYFWFRCGKTVQKVAEQNGDEQLLRRIRGFDLFACEAKFHESCRTSYLQEPTKWRSKAEARCEENISRMETHNQAFHAVCQTIDAEMLKKN